MATLTGIRDYGVLAGDDYLSAPAWQDPAYLGQIKTEQLDDRSLQPMIDNFWRVFGFDRSPAPAAR